MYKIANCANQIKSYEKLTNPQCKLQPLPLVLLRESAVPLLDAGLQKLEFILSHQIDLSKFSIAYPISNATAGVLSAF